MNSTCRTCSALKSHPELFSKNAYSKDGLAGQCKICRKQYMKEYRRTNSKKVQKLCADWRAENKGFIRSQQMAYRREVKMEVMQHYSNGNPKCACCGEDCEYFLTIDHKNGGGNKHRRKLKLPSGNRFYLWLKQNEFPDGYDVLCFNCNGAKGIFGICPHQKPPEEPIRRPRIRGRRFVEQKCLCGNTVKGGPPNRPNKYCSGKCRKLGIARSMAVTRVSEV